MSLQHQLITMKRNLLGFLLCLSILTIGYSQQTVGLFYNQSEAFNGYTLFAPSSSRSTYLIDNCGYEIKKWVSAYNPGLSCYLLEDGRLLRTGRVQGAFNGGGVGGRIEIFSWDGELEWGYNYTSSNYHQHHDVEYLPNGNILVLAWERKTQAEAVEAGRSNPSGNGLWSEHLVEIKPIGADEAEIVWEWHLWDHLSQDIDSSKSNFMVLADHPERVNINVTSGSSADFVHCNAVDFNPELDQIILSAHNFDEFWIIEHTPTSEDAASHEGGKYGRGGDILYRWGNPENYNRGVAADQQLYGQHDVHWVPAGLPDAGKIMLFNNGSDRPGGSYSSVEMIDPPIMEDGLYMIGDTNAFGPDAVHWSYSGEPGDRFFSNRISGVQQQPNGNAMICIGNDGELLEVDTAGNKMWRYIIPVKNNGPITQGTNPSQNSTFRSYRYAPSFAGFEGKELIPGDLIELNPLPSDCQIFDGTTGLYIFAKLEGIHLLNNPAQEQLQVSFEKEGPIQYQIYSMLGIPMKQDIAINPIESIDVTDFTSGTYVIHFTDKAGAVDVQTFNIIQ